MCGTLLCAIFWHRLANDDAKFSFLRFQQHEWEPAAVNLSFFAFAWKPLILCQASESTLHLFCTLWPTWSHRKTLNLMQSSTLMRCFRCSNHCSFLYSLIKDARKKQQSQNSHHFLKIYLQLKFSSPLLSLLLKLLEKKKWHTTLWALFIAWSLSPSSILLVNACWLWCLFNLWSTFSFWEII